MYYSDLPISSGEDDLLGRKPFAKLLAQTLLNLKTPDTFTIGLFGKWGSGKTSVVNMMLHELKALQENNKDDTQIVVVHFEPWNFSSTDQLLSQFFIRLSNEFKSKKDEKLKNLADALDKYSVAFKALEFIPGIGGTLSAVGQSWAKITENELRNGDSQNDILKQKDNIINLLEKQPTRILIVIDDIDRLTSEQIRLTFQLIASVAKFPNIMYLLVFDKDIVVSALKKVQEGNGEDYLEKIIQMPIQIPDVKKDKARQVLIAKLDDIVGEYKDIRFQRERWQRVFSYCVEPLIHTLRDINRLCNSIQFKLAAIASEVDFIDLIAISSLEIALPIVYEWIKGNKAILTGEIDGSMIGLLDKPREESYSDFFNRINTLLKDRAMAETAMDALSQLFPHFGQMIGKSYEAYDSRQLMRDNCVAHPDKFDRYFALDLNDDELKKADILNAVYSLDSNSLRQYLLVLDSQRKSYKFLEEINALILKIQSNRVAVIISALYATSEDLNSVTGRLFTVQASTYAEQLIIKLLKALDHSDRFCLLEKEIKDASRASLPSIAVTINIIELGYGRLAANGEQRIDNMVIPLNELLLLEKGFTERTKQLLQTISLFDFSDWKSIYYLLGYFDPDYIKEYLTKALKNEKNIILFLENSVSTWVGSGTEYAVNNDYQKYLEDEQIVHAIESLKNTGELFQLPENIQKICGAYYLKKVDNSNASHLYGNITQSEVDKLLDSWKI